MYSSLSQLKAKFINQDKLFFLFTDRQTLVSFGEKGNPFHSFKIHFHKILYSFKILFFCYSTKNQQSFVCFFDKKSWTRIWQGRDDTTLILAPNVLSLEPHSSIQIHKMTAKFLFIVNVQVLNLHPERQLHFFCDIISEEINVNAAVVAISSRFSPRNYHNSAHYKNKSRIVFFNSGLLK